MREIAKIVIILLSGGVLSLFGLVTLVWITTITVRALKSVFSRESPQMKELKKILAANEIKSGLAKRRINEFKRITNFQSY